MIDLRSDTVTRPTEAMRAAMLTARVGDDVYGEDPTVAALEAETARVLGKETAVFMPSGTMTNQVAIALHTRHGDEVICEAQGHSYAFESGAGARLSGVQFRPVAGARGVLDLAGVEAAIRPAAYWFPRTALLIVENTHNFGGGTVVPLERCQALAALAHGRGLSAHLDGARLWNATAACGTPEAEFAAPFDTVSVCYSKGLGAPVGSALAGPARLRGEMIRLRKMFGGGMRQAGMLAAAALHALEHHRGRLLDDHANARRLAALLAASPVIACDAAAVETNIVFAALRESSPRDAASWAESARARGVLVSPTGPRQIRLVTHLDVSRTQTEAAAAILTALAEP